MTTQQDQLLLEHYRDLIGPTPVVQLDRISPQPGPTFFAKLEFLLPGGTSSDRAIDYLIRNAEKEGSLRTGSAVVLPTDGTTAPGAAILSRARGYEFIAVMPESTPKGFVEHTRLLGGEVVFSPEHDHIRGAIALAKELINENPGKRVLINLYENSANAEIHKKTTGQEIIHVLGKNIDALVVGIHSGGTIAGCTGALKAVNSRCKVVAVEPAESNVLSGGKPRPHNLHGLGLPAVPPFLNQAPIDEVVKVTVEAAEDGRSVLAEKEGILVGPAGGAVIAAMLEVCEKMGPDQDIVGILNVPGHYYLARPEPEEEEERSEEEAAPVS
ncbi:MAG: cysteine synthase family protein [Candidatus Hydrogenedentota bacterium]|nr:MAG: cysteine synthase family protein [Candidatus Hydrogenedentota bacterium]